MESAYYDIGYLIEIGNEIHGMFGDTESSIRPINIVDVWENKEENNSESTN